MTTGAEASGAGAPRRPGAVRRAIRRASFGRYTGVAVGLVAVCVYLWLSEPAFMTWSNWENIVRGQSVVAILAIGMTVAVLTGGIDLSIASNAAASAMVLGLLVRDGWDWWSAALAAIAVGAALGLLNGLLIGVARIPFFVVTLGTLSVYQSWALLTTNGETISLFSYEQFLPLADLVNGSVGPLPNLLVIVAALYAVGIVALRYTHFGRSVFAVGSNPEAARLSGIKVNLTLVSVYTLCGLTAGLGSVALTGRLTAAGPNIDPNLMLTVVAAVLIGGTAFTGGDGSLVGTIVGVLFLGVVQNGLSLSGVSTFWQGTVSGTILIAAVAIGVVRDYGWRIRFRERRAG